MTTNEVRIALFCNANAEDIYGANGMLLGEYNELAPGDINYAGFSGHLDGSRRMEFIGLASSADIVIMDAWNYREGMTKDPYEEVAGMAREIIRLNPRATVFVQEMEGRADYASHKVPGVRIFDTWNEGQITDEIRIAHHRACRSKYPKLLLFDDNQVHLRFGAKQLSEVFNVWTAANWDEAVRKLERVPFKYLLTDLLVPASMESQGTKGVEYVGKEMPLGPILILLGLSRGVTKFGLVSDMSHHNHPASAALDHLYDYFSVEEETEFYVTNQPSFLKVSADTCELAGENTTGKIVRAKDWLEVVKRIYRA
jgi:CheY-like chemotaxis protein